jgi:hypothetical protein
MWTLRQRHVSEVVCRYEGCVFGQDICREKFWVLFYATPRHVLC